MKFLYGLQKKTVFLIDGIDIKTADSLLKRGYILIGYINWFYGGIEGMRCGNYGKYPFCKETKGASQLECSKFQKKSPEKECKKMDLDNEEVKETKNMNNKKI